MILVRTFGIFGTFGAFGTFGTFSALVHLVHLGNRTFLTLVHGALGEDLLAYHA